MADTIQQRLVQLSSDQLNALGEALLDFRSPADQEQWLSRQPVVAH